MHITNLRKVGGSVMMAVPPAILELLHLNAGSKVGLSVEGDRLVIKSAARPNYTLAGLLAQCDASAEPADEDMEWSRGPAAGEELI